MKKLWAVLLLVFSLALPVQAQEYLLDGLTADPTGGRNLSTPKILFTGLYGERYAALPGRQYLILPPEDSEVSSPVVKKTAAGTYRYHYPKEGIDSPLGRLIESFETTESREREITIPSDYGNAVGQYDAKEAKRLFVLINEERQKEGVPALSWDVSLAEAARTRVTELVLKPGSLRPNGQDFSTAAGNLAAENFLYGYATADIAAARMMELPARKENILNKYFVKSHKTLCNSALPRIS